MEYPPLNWNILYSLSGWESDVQDLILTKKMLLMEKNRNENQRINPNKAIKIKKPQIPCKRKASILSA